MAFNGSGVFNRLYNWVNDAAANIKIRADRMDAEMDGMATGLSTCITKNGQTTITANLPMATYRHTGVGAGVNRTDYARLDQAQDGKLAWVDGGGTADAITAAYSIAITALVDGQLCYVRATAANATTTPTFSPSGLTARTIVKNGGSALVAGDIAGDGHELVLRYDLANTRWELLNPATVSTITTTLPINKGGTGQTTQTAAFDALSPTTTKGDIIVDNGANAIRLAVGATNGMLLTVDSAQSAGVKWALPTAPTRQYLTSGTTYTTPAGCRKIIVKMVGAGGGGGARTTNNGSDGGDTSFNSVVAEGGGGGTYGADSAVSRGGLGGTGGTGTANLRIPGGGGTFLTGPSSPGGSNPLFPSQGATTIPAGNAVNGNRGCGGGGGNSNSATTYSGGGGGGGEYVELIIDSPAASYTYAIGTGGTGGSAGGLAGGNGGDGFILVEEYY